MKSPPRHFNVFKALPLPAGPIGNTAATAVPPGFETVPPHLQGQTGTNELGKGIEKREFPPMTEAQLDECLSRIPNTTTDWETWNNVGMEVFAACDGADYGLNAWERWSAKNPNHVGEQSQRTDAWQRLHSCPPTRTGAGALVKKARLGSGDQNWSPSQPVNNANAGGGAAVPGGNVVTPLVTASFTSGLNKHKTKNLPHRFWLYGVDLMRGEITVVASPGGVGKSSLAIGMAICMVLEKDLLGEIIWGAEHRVLFLNGEDSRDEVERRIWAFCLKHNIPMQDLQDKLYCAGADDWQVQKISLLRTEKGNSILDNDGFAVLEAMLNEVRPSLVVIDPLINFCAGGNVNDNAVMALVMRKLKTLSAQYDCSVMIVHHTRKGGDLNSQEAVSGAAAIVNLSRRTLMTIPMTLEDAKELNVLPSNRWRYFRVAATKTNVSPRTDNSPWYELASVTLPNPEPPVYPHGDNVQAVVRAKLQAQQAAAAFTVDDKIVMRAILDVVQRGKKIGGDYHPYSQKAVGANNQRALLPDAMTAVKHATPGRGWAKGDLEAVATRHVTRMLVDGWLVEEQIKDGRFRRSRGLQVNWPVTPWPDAMKDEVTPEVTEEEESDVAEEEELDGGDS